MKYVIIGNGTAAVGAIEGIRSADKVGPITVISTEPYHVYGRPLISYMLLGKTTEEKMLRYRPDDFYEKNNVTAMLGKTVQHIDSKKQTVTLESGESVPYDRLCICTGSRPNEVKVDNTWYKVVTDSTNEDTNSITAGNTYDLAIVGNYVVNAKETEGNSNDVLIVTDYEKTNNGMAGSTTQKVKAYFLDGSSKTIEVEKLSLEMGKDEKDVTSTNKVDENTVNNLYTYSVRSNGNYTLKLLGTKNMAGYDTVSAKADKKANFLSSKKIDKNNKIDGILINDDAVVINLYKSKIDSTNVYSDVKVTTGKTINDMKIANTGLAVSAAYATKKSNGVESIRVLVVAADDNSKLSGAGSDYSYAYLTADPYNTKDGEDNDESTVYEVWNGSENLVLKTDGKDTDRGLKKGDVLAYSNDGDKYITVENSNVTIKAVAITGIEAKSEGHIVLKSNDVNVNGTYQLDKDCVYIAVNSDDHEGMEGGSVSGIAKAEEVSGAAKYYANAYVVIENDSDHHVLAVIYDADSNRLDGAANINK